MSEEEAENYHPGVITSECSIDAVTMTVTNINEEKVTGTKPKTAPKRKNSKPKVKKEAEQKPHWIISPDLGEFPNVANREQAPPTPGSGPGTPATASPRTPATTIAPPAIMTRSRKKKAAEKTAESDTSVSEETAGLLPAAGASNVVVRQSAQTVVWKSNSGQVNSLTPAQVRANVDDSYCQSSISFLNRSLKSHSLELKAGTETARGPPLKPSQHYSNIYPSFMLRPLSGNLQPQPVSNFNCVIMFCVKIQTLS